MWPAGCGGFPIPAVGDDIQCAIDSIRAKPAAESRHYEKAEKRDAVFFSHDLKPFPSNHHNLWMEKGECDLISSSQSIPIAITANDVFLAPFFCFILAITISSSIIGFACLMYINWHTFHKQSTKPSLIYFRISLLYALQRWFISSLKKDTSNFKLLT